MSIGGREGESHSQRRAGGAVHAMGEGAAEQIKDELAELPLVARQASHHEGHGVFTPAPI